MENHSKRRRDSGRYPRKFRIVDLGLCSEPSCVLSDRFHRHGFAYFYWTPDPELIDSTQKTLIALGYSGEIEVSRLSPDVFKKFYGRYL